MLPPLGHPKRTAYLAKVARSVGCPEWLIEDATQDMELTFLIKGTDFVRSAAIDFLRREGPHDRKGRPRPQAKSIDPEADDLDYWWESDETDEVIARVDAPRTLRLAVGIFRQLSPLSKMYVLTYLRGESANNNGRAHVHLYQFRQKLKAIA